MTFAFAPRMFKAHLRSTVMTSVVVVGLAGALLILGGTVATVQVASPRIEPIYPPPEEPVEPAPAARLSFEDLVYQGAFKVPEESNGESFSYGGQALAYNPVTNTLFISSLHSKVAEVSIPTPVKSDKAEELPIASVVQAFRDPADGRLRDIAEDGVVLDGLLVHEGRLYGTGLIYYDASNSQRVSHFARSLDLTRPDTTRVHQVGEKGKSGYVAGYMATVPSEWREALGGPAVTGQCCISIISRSSFGPALFAWNPTEVGRRDPVPAIPLLYYPQEHATLGPWEGTNEIFGGTTEMAGVAVIDGTTTVLFAGRNGVGAFCYGEGTDDEKKASEPQRGDQKYCYDPTSTDKGQHAFPYRLQFWAYDVKDLAAVRAGDKRPWELKPYAVWPFQLPPIGDPYPRLGAMSYDSARRRLFLTQLFGDKDGYARRPIVHVFNVRQR